MRTCTNPLLCPHPPTHANPSLHCAPTEARLISLAAVGRPRPVDGGGLPGRLVVDLCDEGFHGMKQDGDELAGVRSQLEALGRAGWVEVRMEGSGV
jgi:hypothetical protein